MPEHSHRHAAHHHGHPHGQDHGHGFETADERRVRLAFLTILGFMLLEILGGLASGSLALLADAGHMASDTAALGMSWFALRIGRRPADPERSYGYQRLEVLAAFVNGCALFLIALWITAEAGWRLGTPVPVAGGLMFATAFAGLLANLAVYRILHGANRKNLNIRSAWLHVLGDVLGFVVTILAALVILWTGWSPVDPILSLLVALLILHSASGIVRSSGHILLEGTPQGFDPEILKADLLAAVPAVAEVHHLHIWSLTAEETLATFHVRSVPDADPADLIPQINQRLKERFGIAHSTIQVDPGACPDEHHC